jgi:pimeloyl-ACP methyl ester carboxylesterase
MTANDIDAFHLAVPQRELDDLRRRLELTRWPTRETVADWTQGVPLDRLRVLIGHWIDRYDWRRCEAMLNAFGQYKTVLDGLEIHFLHIRSPQPGALPLLLTHGWPGSVIEFHKVVAPLSDPVPHGGSPEDAFDLIIPSLPGYGFSAPPTEPGWNVERIAGAWHALMQRLGYRRYLAQGGDWGAMVTTALGAMRPPELAGIHLNMPYVIPPPPWGELDEAQSRAAAALAHFDRWDGAYSRLQASRPQTLGYGLADSPAGQAAWIYEKFCSWMDCEGVPEQVLSLDEMLDNIMLYWLPNTGASAGRLYWENAMVGTRAVELHLPVGCSLFPKETIRAPRRWADRYLHDIVYWNELERGGHFAAFEQPDLFVQELRRFGKLFR